MPNRSIRASIVFLNNLLHQFAAAFVSLFITPLIVANLGADVFGVWKIITRTTEFLTLGNLKPLGLLKLTLAKDISNNDFIYKQQQVGAAFSILILTLPIVLILSFLLFYFRDIFIPVSKDISHQVDLALLIMIVHMIISPFLYAPGTIVWGLNLQYKLFGISSITEIISASLAYAVVAQGYTLPWIAAIEYLPMLSAAVINYIIIVKSVPWFKLVWPPEVITWSFFKNNLWALLTNTFRYIYTLADLILIGMYFGATTTAIYSLTKTLIIFLFMPANSLVQSVLAGIGDLVGRKELKSLLQLRSEQINVAIFVSFIITVIVMFFNASFVGLWIDEKHFGGETLSRWILVAAIVDVLVKIEANYLDASLKLKGQTLSLGATSIVYLAIIVLCEPLLGLNVFPIAQAISQAILIILYWAGLRDCLDVKFGNLARVVLRPLCIAAVLVSSILWVRLPVAQGWVELFTHAFKVSVLTGIIGWFLILQKTDKKLLMIRLSNVF